MSASIRIGNAPCSWGSLEFEGMEGKGIGYAQMLDELAETGYAGTELGDWGYMPTVPGALRAELERRSLTMLGAFVPVALKHKERHAPGTAVAVRTARLLAAVAAPDYAPCLVLADENGTVPARTQNAGRVTADLALSADEWAVFAAGAEEVARAVRDDTGLRTVFHHHCAGYVETPDEIAALMRRTDPELLGLVFDTGHYALGTGSPATDAVLEGLDRFADRIWYMHYKDCAPEVAARVREQRLDYFEAVAQGVFCELGQGCCDFARGSAWLRDRAYDGWICVEQDVLPGMGAPRDSARRNREFLRGLGL
ncbi:MAG TPA: TIM barrel protein [Candidatus Hydrogenedentes bacterium]|nr:TIM barrel protein [Candidatus Hydrogenedentota bacterium]HNT86830.1 TIM barrel protein [Candidatus Hydrogenedentota bacterium]